MTNTLTHKPLSKKTVECLRDPTVYAAPIKRLQEHMESMTTLYVKNAVMNWGIALAALRELIARNVRK